MKRNEFRSYAIGGDVNSKQFISLTLTSESCGIYIYIYIYSLAAVITVRKVILKLILLVDGYSVVRNCPNQTLLNYKSVLAQVIA